MTRIETVRVMRDGRQKIINKTDLLEGDELLDGSGNALPKKAAKVEKPENTETKTDDSQGGGDGKGGGDDDEPATVQIPADWAEKGTGNHTKRISIAKQLRPDIADDIKKDEQAIEIIEEAIAIAKAAAAAAAEGAGE